MIISRRARYALHGVGFLAYRSSGGEPVQFGEIIAYLRAYSHQLSLSPGYISKIFQDLSRAGIVQAVPGRKGGYRLARPAQEIPLLHVVTAIDGPLVEGCCLLAIGHCTMQDHCGVYTVIREAQNRFSSFLTEETVASMSRKMAIPKSVRRPSSVRRRR